MMHKKAWHKLQPGVVFDVLSAMPDNKGVLPVLAYDSRYNEGNPFYSLVPESQLSYKETAPVPDGVPELAYVVLYGQNPASWKGSMFATEREALQFIDTIIEGMSSSVSVYGYVPVNVQRGAMIPV